MWPIWEWFVDADSYAVWADRTVASSRILASFEPPKTDGDGNFAPRQSEHLSLAKEAATPSASEAARLSRIRALPTQQVRSSAGTT